MQVVWVVVFLVLGVSADPKMRDIEGLIDHTVTDSPTEPFDIIVDTEDTKLTEDEYFLFQENIRQFGNEVFSKITQSNPNENVFFSPSSISISLAILMLGSEGETQENLIRTLHLDQLSMPKIATAFLLLITDIYHSDSEVTIHMTNQLWSEVELWDSFISMSKEFFHSHLEQISFQDPELVRERINQEIAKLTNDKILDLLPPGSIDRQTILVITNAIYFKGDWHHVFNEEQTKDDFFTLHSGEQVTVPMMNIEKSFRYAYEDGIHVVEIPYEGKEFSMVVYYPDDAKEFDFTSIPEISLSELKPTVLALSMPKFRVETKVQLKEMLKDMGLEILFGNGCDLSGITPRTNQLEVDEIYHQAFVEVNEQGTEAAAATAVVILERAMFMPSTSLVLNHPFIFEIINTNTEHAVFSGLLNNPLSG